MTTTAVKSAAMTSRRNTESESVKLQKRIGSTTFKVAVRFSSTSTETMEDKLLRLIEREVGKSA
jgi:hypothetical protein